MLDKLRPLWSQTDGAKPLTRGDDLNALTLIAESPRQQRSVHLRATHLTWASGWGTHHRLVVVNLIAVHSTCLIYLLPQVSTS